MSETRRRIARGENPTLAMGHSRAQHRENDHMQAHAGRARLLRVPARQRANPWSRSNAPLRLFWSPGKILGVLPDGLEAPSSGERAHARAVARDPQRVGAEPALLPVHSGHQLVLV